MAVSTTVKVKWSTAKVLDELKRKYGAKSMDETLRRLIGRAENIPDSMLGSPQDETFQSRR